MPSTAPGDMSVSTKVASPTMFSSSSRPDWPSYSRCRPEPRPSRRPSVGGRVGADQLDRLHADRAAGVVEQPRAGAEKDRDHVEGELVDEIDRRYCPPTLGPPIIATSPPSAGSSPAAARGAGAPAPGPAPRTSIGRRFFLSQLGLLLCVGR